MSLPLSDLDNRNKVKIELMSLCPGLCGLRKIEGENRLKFHGPNETNLHRDSNFRKFIRYFYGPIPFLIEAAVILSGILHNWMDLTIIMALLWMNIFPNEWLCLISMCSLDGRTYFFDSNDSYL